jgi:aspartate racemase
VKDNASSFSKSKTVGILGGMGPYASSSFLQEILNNTPVNNDRDHLRIILDSNPHIPSRTRAILYGEESPLQGMIDSCRQLSNYPVDFIVLPCNSASAWIDELREHISVPILNIIEITVKKISQCIPAPAKIAVWGGRVTWQKESYRKYLGNITGMTYIQHTENIQNQIESFIERIKLNKIEHNLISEINTLAKYFLNTLEVNCIILGCTEFGCIPRESYDFPCINSLSVYADEVVRYAKS